MFEASLLYLPSPRNACLEKQKQQNKKTNVDPTEPSPSFRVDRRGWGVSPAAADASNESYVASPWSPRLFSVGDAQPSGPSP